MAKAYVSLALVLYFAFTANALAAQSPRLAWSDLNAAQQQVLAPLEADWARLSTDQRRGWIALADRYPKMSAAEQKRVQDRMRDWAKLTPQQRAAARARYRALSKLSPDQRREIIRQWTESQEAQQALPADSAPATTESTESAKPAEPVQPGSGEKPAETASGAAPESEKPSAATQ
jgi:hypothetical protein